MAIKPSKVSRVENILEDQVIKWQKQVDRRKKTPDAKGPVITISRQPGTPSDTLITKIATALKLDVFDNEIINAVAESVKMSEKVIASLDERTRSALDNWIQILKSSRYLLPDTYLTHLTKVIGTIGEQGGAIIVGRGANLILPPETTLRVRLVAPLGTRIMNLSKEEAIGSIDEAQRQINKKESEQRAYIRKYFEVDIDDPVQYDLVVNAQFMSDDQIIDVIKAGMKNKKAPSRRRFDETTKK